MFGGSYRSPCDAGVVWHRWNRSSLTVFGKAYRDAIVDNERTGSADQKRKLRLVSLLSEFGERPSQRVLSERKPSPNDNSVSRIVTYSPR
jgi:hypothetical protein